MTTSGRLGIVTTVPVRVTVTAVLGNKHENVDGDDGDRGLAGRTMKTDLDRIPLGQRKPILKEQIKERCGNSVRRVFHDGPVYSCSFIPFCT